MTEKETNQSESNIITVAATVASRDDGRSLHRHQPTQKFKVEIQPGLFRRLHTTFTSNEDLYNRLAETFGTKVAYYEDEDGHTTIVDGPNDIPGLLDVFGQVDGQDRVARMRLFDADEEDRFDIDHDSLIRPSDLIKIISEDGRLCLDIGAASVREVGNDVISKTTKIRIRRLDGPSEGFVSTKHTVGLFSEDNNFRLDVGFAAVHNEVCASHNSWATLLHIRRIRKDRDNDRRDNKPLRYEELVGVFSTYNNKRLDLGPMSMKKPCVASHVSWATKLNIHIKERRD